MKINKIKEQKVLYITFLSLMLSLACTLYYLENLFITPFVPLPGGKIGIANLVSLVLIYTLGIKEALIVTILRVLIVNIILGGFLNISFYLGLFGGIVSSIIMGLCFGSKISIVTNSIIGALAHNFTQLIIVLFFVFHSAILYYMPFLVVFGILTGLFNGIIGGYIIKFLKNYLGGEV